MKLTCPNCGAGFEVRAEALGAAGRKVRCSACRYQWLARPAPETPQPEVPPAETPAAQAPAAPLVAAPPEPAPTIELTPAALAEPEIEPPDIAALREAAILHPTAPAPPLRAPKDAPSAPGATPMRAEAPPPRRRAAMIGWVLFAAVVVGLGVAVLMRQEVMESFPQTRPIFGAFGFRVPSATDGLLIVDVRSTWTRNSGPGEATLLIEGRVNNLSNRPRDLPPLRGVLSDGQREVHNWTFSLGQPRLEAGEGVNFRTEVRPPARASTIAIVFAPAE